MHFRGRAMADIDVATAQKIVVVTTTYYPDAEDVRFALALELCRLARRRRVRLVLVDGSPRHDAVREALERAGTAVYAHVVRQDADDFPGKGGALRQAIRHATALLRAGDAADDAVICFAEPEKVNLMNHVAAVAKPIFDGSADVVVPRRSEELFRQTYPIEQYHSESFGNRHFDLLARQHAKQPAGGALDWLFGPVAFKAGLAEGWLGYGGTSWDAQVCKSNKATQPHRHFASLCTSSSLIACLPTPLPPGTRR